MTGERCGSRGWFTESGGANRFVGKVKKPKKVQKNPQIEQIFSMLKERDMTSTELAAALGVGINRVHGLLIVADLSPGSRIFEVSEMDQGKQHVYGWADNYLEEEEV